MRWGLNFINTMKLTQLITKTNYYRIKVIVQQSKVELRGVMADGTIKIALTKPPERGKANKELVEYFAEELNIQKGAIRITSGLTNRIKLVHIDKD